MLIRKPTDLAWSDVTPKAHYCGGASSCGRPPCRPVAGAAGWLAIGGRRPRRKAAWRS